MNTKLLRLTILSILFSSIALSSPVSKPYVWKNVQMVGGGFVSGIVFHPTAKGVCYARTDMGGAYRWNDKNQRWDAITDWISYEDRNSMGVESIAVDPSNPDYVYIACGTYTGPDIPNAAIFRSGDRGKTFHRADVPFKMGGNEDGRGNGERMAVDPHDGKIIYFGSRNDGLWKSNDRGATWSRVESFPDVKEAPPAAQPTPPADPNNRQRRGFGGFRRPRSSGIITVVFDPTSGSKDKACSTIYVTVSLMSRDNLFCSKDSGKTWQPVAGQPTQYRPTHAILASNGMLYISYGTSPGPSRSNDGGVWKYDTHKGEWTDITPVKPSEGNTFGYAAVSVDASNPDVIIASTHYRPAKDDIFRTTNGGKTWKPVFKSGAEFVYDKAPYVKRTGVHWMFDIEIDPTNPNHAIFTTGYGGHETFNLTDADKGKPTIWNVMSTGIEETVALELLSPPKGAQLITAIGDYGGFVHWDLDKPAPEGNFDHPPFGNTNGVACGDLKPEIIVRVGNPTGNNNRDASSIAYSLDEGKNWQAANPPQPASRSGFIAVSADGQTWVWTPGRMAAYVTTDRGLNWKECNSLPTNTRVISDRVISKKFYAIDLFKGKLFISTDSAATFTEQMLSLPGGLPKPPAARGESRGDARGGQDRLYATPNKEGDLWLAAFDGLYHSTDTGKTFVKLAGVQEILAFGFGKAAPKTDYSALYLIGVVDGVRGAFRSDDTAKTWVKINDDQHQWGLVLQITGDPKKYGRVYVGTHGRGTLYGDPAN